MFILGQFANSMGQNTDILTVVLQNKKTSYRVGQITPTRVLSNIKETYAGLPKDVDRYEISVIDMQLKQSIYSRFLSGEMDSARYNLLSKMYQIEDSAYSKNFVNQGIKVFSALKGSKKIIICDSNNNNDFSDDSVQVFDISLRNKRISLDSLTPFVVNYEYFYKNQILKKTSWIKLRPFDVSYMIKDSVKKLLLVVCSIAEHHKALTEIKGKYFTITLPGTLFKGGDYKTAPVIFTDSLDNKESAITPLPRIGEQFVLNENVKAKILSISEFGDTLKLQVYENNELEIGYRLGDRTVLSSFQDINNEDFNPEKNTKKYIMLDFWGTWCVPCVAGIPKLKAFYEKYKDNIELISIACDKDIEKVKKFVRDKQMNWIHKFELNSNNLNSEQWVNQLRIECYPTFILLDRNGKILSRGCGGEQLSKIAKILN